MNEWQEVTLGEVLQPKGYIRGPFGSSLKRNEMQENGIPVYEQANAIYNHRIFRFFIDNEKFEQMKRFQVCTDDLIISCSGTVGEVSIIQEKDEKGIISQALLLLRVDKAMISSDYLKYFFISSEGYNAIISRSSGSVQVNISKRSVIEAIPIKLPPLPEQKAIADTLSCLDDKIELNNKINKNLEEMAQAIFKSWFVDFEPFKDGEFVDSELGKIPKGWRVIPLYDFANYINGSSFKKDEYDSIGIPIIKIAELKNGITNSTEYFNGIKPEKFYIKDKDILFSWSGNPDTSIDIFIWNGGVAILNQHTFKVESYNNTQGFIFLVLKHFKSEFAEIARNKQTTGLGHVTVADLKRLQFVIDEQTIAEFENIIKPTLDQIFVNMKQNQKLAQIRDTLLPKLMSGKVRVPVEK